MKEIMQTYGAMIVAVVVGIALLSGFGALKNKMSVAFAPQDILSSVYDLLDVTAHEDNLDKLEVYALYDSGRNDCTGSISADGSSLSFPDYGVYDMHVRITCKNGTRDHVRISIPINRKVADI